MLNPRSRKNLRDPGALSRLARALGDHGVVREAGSLDDLQRIAEDYARLRIDVLAISGGDGTNHVTITGFLEAYGGMALPRVAFLRGGTMNTVANSVGVPRGKPEVLLARLARAYAARTAAPLRDVERHVMRIGNHYGFLFGTGVVRGFLAEYYRDAEPSPFVAAKVLARSMGSALVGGEIIRRMAEPFRGTVEIDGGEVWPSRDYLTVCAGTIDQMGLGFRPFRRSGERPGTFHMLGIHTSPVKLLPELPRIWRGEAMRPGRALEATPVRAVLRSARPTLGYMIDGDLHETSGELEVSVGPRVKIVVAPCHDDPSLRQEPPDSGLVGISQGGG